MFDESPEEPSSYPKSIRISPEKQKLLDELGISLKDAVDEGINKKVKEKEKLTKAQKRTKAIIDGIYLMIGVAFIWTLNFTNSIYSIAIVGGLGLGFTIFGGYNLYKGMKAEGIFDKLKSR